MIRNYCITALRNILRYKGTSVINVISLSTAMAFSILVFLYVKHEYSYDTFHEKSDLIYFVSASSESMILNISEKLGPTLMQQYPEIEACIRFGFTEAEVTIGPDHFNQRVYAADHPFFETFTFPLDQGADPFPADNPDVIVISPAVAQKYFGSEPPMGQTISLILGDEKRDFVITAVISSIPDNSSVGFDLIIPTRQAMFEEDLGAISAWQSFEFGTFIRLVPAGDLSRLQAKSRSFLREHMSDVFQKISLDPENFRLDFLPLTDFHLRSESTSGGLVPPGNPLHSLLLSGIGLLVLMISCFNFINLSVARSSSRFKEIGVRKVVGASRFGLIKQFWFESNALSLMALLLSIGLAEILRPMFNALSGKNLTLEQHFYSPGTFIFLASLAWFIGIILGVYPALFISRISLVNILKGKQRIEGRKRFSRIVVAFQFSLSLFLIIEAAVVYKQKNFLMTRDPGFIKENILAFPAKTGEKRNPDGETLLSLFKNQLAGHPKIRAVTGASGILDKNLSALVRRKDKAPVLTVLSRIDHDFLNTLEIELVEGRNFSPDIISDPLDAVIVNETFVRTFEIDNPIGSPITDLDHGKLVDPKIIGVAKDFNYTSLRDRIYPMILHMDRETDINYIVVKTVADGISGTLNDLQGLWTQFRPDLTFEYFFFDEELRGQYGEEERWNRIVGYSAFFAIFIAALGLFGMAGITIARRFKEIGIRKVLGASPVEIIQMVNREYLVLVALSNVAVWPVAYVVSSKWLQNFAYRTALTPWEFILGGAVVLGVAVLTISSQAFKAAVRNPAVVLHDE